MLPDFDASFTIASVESFHLVPAGRGYWEGYLDGRTREADRFLLAAGWRTAYPQQVETALIRVAFADGTVGWGEPNAPIAPEITCQIAHKLLAPLVAGRDFPSPFAMWDFLYDTQRGRGHQGSFFLDAIAALDIGVWDALGRRHGRPLAALLTDTPLQQIPVYLSGLRQTTRDERIATARAWAEGGLQGIKIFLQGDTAAGCEELAALQQAVPAVERWMVDVLWSYERLEDAAAAKAAYGELNALWLECPLLPEDLDGHKELRKRPGAPVALGESFHTRFEARPWLEGGALDLFQPDIGRCGISDGLRQKAIGKAVGVSVTPHMGSGLDVFQAATLQFAAACSSEFLCEFQAGLSGRLGDGVHTAWRYEDGGFRLPERPGLGVEVDLEALAPFIVSRFT